MSSGSPIIDSPIIDSHSHAWATWPYKPPVPDPETRGRAEQLLYEMDVCSVAQAVLVSANIDHNPENNVYVAAQVRRYPERLHQFADVDCAWSATYHTPGAAERLRNAAARYPLKGFTHYLRADDDGSWLYTDEGSAFFTAAAELKLIASISCAPHQQAALRKVAERFPDLPILVHHLGHPQVGHDEQLEEVLASARHPNIYLKLSGFYYTVADTAWDFPYHSTHDLVRALYDGFGGERLCWGSDYPVVRGFMTYRQALEAFRTHCDFISQDDRTMILGANLARLLEQARPVNLEEHG